MGKDIGILRELAGRVAEIAALPEQEAKRGMWRALNAKKPDRPLVMIDQVCWNEMNVGDELTLRCEGEELRAIEFRLRSLLYQWKHFRVDMVMDDFYPVQKAVRGIDFGVGVDEQLLSMDKSNDVVSHHYTNQIHSPEDVEKIKTPHVWHDEAETKRRVELAAPVFDGIMDVRVQGITPPVCIWDPITQWMGPDELLFKLAEDPDMMHAMAKRMSDGYLSMYDQLEAQNLIVGRQSLIHCTGAWTDDLPGADFDPDKPLCKNIWVFGLAQIFCSVSPAMFDEYEIQYALPLFNRFGLLYYGCCDPLDRKMAQVRKIPNCRKVSMSPWVDKERGACEIHGDYVYSCKPNPAFLAASPFDEDMVRRDLTETRDLCRKYGCALEIILKDISTVQYKPQNLWRWAEIAMEVANG